MSWLSSSEDSGTRIDEWFVPRWGGRRFRLLVGMAFPPYTLMNAAYVVLGSTLATVIHWDRALAVTFVYILAVGVTAHALDALGPNRPWGDVLSPRQLRGLAIGSLAPALAIGAYYALLFAPVLLVVGTVELFFLFAYNLELFGSRFHSKAWFAISWGFLPVQAGYAVQTGTLDILSMVGGLFGLITAYAEASASRPYKLLKSAPGARDRRKVLRYERTLKGTVLTVLLVTSIMVLLRL